MTRVINFYFCFQIYRSTESFLRSEDLRKAQQSQKIKHQFLLAIATVWIEKRLRARIPIAFEPTSASGYHQSELSIVAGKSHRCVVAEREVEFVEGDRRYLAEEIKFAQTRIMRIDS